MPKPEPLGWDSSALAWIASQGEHGDNSRRFILDPCLDGLLSDVQGKSVLDVGCGEGRYCRKLARMGAEVTGIDPVGAFIQRARELDSSSRYEVGFGESLPFADGCFDVVLSYLSLVDIQGYVAASLEMSRVLRSGGRLFLVTLSNLASPSDGWIKSEDGVKLHRAVDRYMEEFHLDLEWSGISIRNYHRPLSAILAPFFQSGLVVDGFFEPLPDPSSPYFREESRCPTFQIIRFYKEQANSLIENVR